MAFWNPSQARTNQKNQIESLILIQQTDTTKKKKKKKFAWSEESSFVFSDEKPGRSYRRDDMHPAFICHQLGFSESL